MYYWYILFAVPPLVLGLAAQAWVKRAFAEGSKVAGVVRASPARRSAGRCSTPADSRT